MSVGWNLGSILMGLAAWSLSALGIRLKRQSRILHTAGFGCCCTALVFQFCEIDRRTDLSDYAAIEDTIEGVIFCAIVLIAVTLGLNLISLLRHRENSTERWDDNG